MKYFDNNSFLRKTIQSDSPLYRSRIKSLPKNKDTQERLKLYKHIKSDPNAVFTFYHGTSESIWNAIQEKGYFTSPKIRNKEQREARGAGLEEVFFTTSVTYANSYAERAERQTKTKGIILELRIPIYYCKEVSDVILGTESVDKIYNEFNIPYKINEIIENKQIDIKQKAEAIKKFYTNKIEEKTWDEFTIKHAVPIKFVVGNSENSKSLWKRWIEENPAKYEKAIELFPNDKDIYEAGKQFLLKLVKQYPTLYYLKAITLSPNDKDIYEIGKQGYLELVKKYPTFYYEKAIALFSDDKEEFNEAYKQGWLQLVKKYPSDYYEQASRLFPNDKEEFYEVGKQFYLQAVKEKPNYYEDAIKLFPNDKEMFYELARQAYPQFLKQHPEYYQDAIKLFPNDKEMFYELARQAYPQFLKQHPENYQDAIESFPNDKEMFYELGRQGYLELVRKNPTDFMLYLTAELIFPNNKELFVEARKQGLLQTVKKYPEYYQDAIESFPNDKEMFYEAAKQGYIELVKEKPNYYEQAIKLFPKAKHEFDIAAGKITQEQPKKACGWYSFIKRLTCI